MNSHRDSGIFEGVVSAAAATSKIAAILTLF